MQPKEFNIGDKVIILPVPPRDLREKDENETFDQIIHRRKEYLPYTREGELGIIVNKFDNGSGNRFIVKFFSDKKEVIYYSDYLFALASIFQIRKKYKLYLK